jgi:hypothetical protein
VAVLDLPGATENQADWMLRSIKFNRFCLLDNPQGAHFHKPFGVECATAPIDIPVCIRMISPPDICLSNSIRGTGKRYRFALRGSFKEI